MVFVTVRAGRGAEPPAARTGLPLSSSGTGELTGGTRPPNRQASPDAAPAALASEPVGEAIQNAVPGASDSCHL